MEPYMIAVIAVAAVAVTGIFGSIVAKTFLRFLKITNPIAVGLACGNSAHAMATSKALEFGELEGAMSGVSIGVAGLLTVLLAAVW